MPQIQHVESVAGKQMALEPIPSIFDWMFDTKPSLTEPIRYGECQEKTEWKHFLQFILVGIGINHQLIEEFSLFDAKFFAAGELENILPPDKCIKTHAAPFELFFITASFFSVTVGAHCLIVIDMILPTFGPGTNMILGHQDFPTLLIVSVKIEMVIGMGKRTFFIKDRTHNITSGTLQSPDREGSEPGRS